MTETADHPPVHWGFWATIVWAAAIAVLFVVAQMVSTALALMMRNPEMSEAEIARLFETVGIDGHIVSVSAIFSAVVGCALIAIAVKLKKGARLAEYLCIRPVAMRPMLQWFGVLAALIVLTDLLSVMLGRPLVPPFVASVYATAQPLWLLWVAVGLAAPLVEEAFFRGFLFRGLGSSFLGPFGTILATAALWAAIHTQYDWYDMSVIFLLGLLVGAARHYSGSILAPVALHATTGLVSLCEAAIFG